MANNTFLNKGFSLMEVTVGLAVIGVILLIAVPSFSIRVKNAKYQATVKEMSTIALAAIDYYLSTAPINTWPTSVDQIQQPYIAQPVTSNPFGNGYQLSTVGELVTVSSLVPQGLAQYSNVGTMLSVTPSGGQDLVSISQRIPNEITGRLSYEKKYTYHQ